MIDLIGYWFNVSVLTYIGVIPPLFLLIFFLVIPCIAGAIPDYRDSRRFNDWFWDFNSYRLPSGYHSTYCTFFGERIKIPEKLFTSAGGVSCVMSAVWWLMACARWFDEGLGIITWVSKAAEVTAPASAYVAMTLMLVLAARMATKYIYYALKFKEKVTNHMSDKEIHND